jgi:apolipoprotein D and lipocalin family protein
MAGPFFTEGTFTKNTPAQVDDLMQRLDDWANGRRPKDLEEQAQSMARCSQARVDGPLKPLDRAIELSRFMGRWYVIANIPTAFDKGTINNIEEYRYDEANKTILVDFLYCDEKLTKQSCLKQRATVANATCTQWKLSPKVGIYLPVSIPYIIADCAEDYSSTIIGVPDRGYVWIMTRVSNPEQSVIDELIKKAQSLGYDVGKLNHVKQNWPKDNDLPVAEIDEDALVGA